MTSYYDIKKIDKSKYELKLVLKNQANKLQSIFFPPVFSLLSDFLFTLFEPSPA